MFNSIADGTSNSASQPTSTRLPRVVPPPEEKESRRKKALVKIRLKVPKATVMSVSWQPTFRPTYIGNPLPPGGGFGTHNTSSGDYGNWFGNKPAPMTLTIPRKVPTRKLGALNVTNSEQRNSMTLTNPYSNDNDLDQTGKVTSFLTKVNGESRVPRSPRTPDLIDLPGRIVRAPRTRHMTPRNSPDLYEQHPDEGLLINVTQRVGKLNSTEVSQGQYPQGALMERSNTFTDRVRDNRYPLNERGMPGFERSMSTFDSIPNSHGQHMAPVSAKDYVIPKFPLERSYTQPNIMDHSHTNSHFQRSYAEANSNQPWMNQVPSMNSHLQRSQTMMEGSGKAMLRHNQLEDNEFKTRMNFQHVPYSEGNVAPQRAEDTTLANHLPINAHMRNYLFSMGPNSNAVKNAGDTIVDQSSLKPRIPMYWLYGSRGRPSAGNDLPISYEQSTSLNDKTFTNNNHMMDPDRKNKSFGESDFLTSVSERRDAYRSNYSSYEDQRQTNDMGSSEQMALGMTEGVVNLEGPKIKSILKKTSSLQTGSPFVGVTPGRMKAVPGARLPHLNPTKGNKKVKFVL